MDGTDGRLLIRLQTEPFLGLIFQIEGGKHYVLPLNATMAQSLALALLAQPGVGGDILPGLLEDYIEEKARRHTAQPTSAPKPGRQEVAIAN